MEDRGRERGTEKEGQKKRDRERGTMTKGQKGRKVKGRCGWG